MNILKTTVLMTVLTLLLVWLGEALAGPRGAWMFLVIAAVMNLFSYWFSDKMVLAMYRAKPIPREQAPELYQIVEGLAQRSGTPVPPIYLVPSDSPNAFATGRNPKHAVVAVTQGILRLLHRDELEAVLAHELGHVRNRDILIGSIVATIASAITLISRAAMWGAMLGGGGGRRDRGGNPLALLLAMIVAPIAAVIVQLAISRTREFAADSTGALPCGKPLALASALRKLERGATAVPMTNASPATAHQFIVNPLRGASLAGLFSTHPRTDDRVARLEDLARSMGQLGGPLH